MGRMRVETPATAHSTPPSGAHDSSASADAPGWSILEAVAAWNATATAPGERVTPGPVARHCRLGLIPGARLVNRTPYGNPWWDIPRGAERPKRLKQGRPPVKDTDVSTLSGMSGAKARAKPVGKRRRKRSRSGARKPRMNGASTAAPVTS